MKKCTPYATIPEAKRDEVSGFLIEPVEQLEVEETRKHEIHTNPSRVTTCSDRDAPIPTVSYTQAVFSDSLAYRLCLRCTAPSLRPDNPRGPGPAGEAISEPEDQPLPDVGDESQGTGQADISAPCQ